MTLQRRQALGLTLLPWAGRSLAEPLFRNGPAHPGVQAPAAPRQAPRLRWSFQTGERVMGSPIEHQGLILVGSDDGLLYALESATGRLRWAYRTRGPVPSTPAVHEDLAYLTSYDGKLHAVDLATGQARWKFATEGERRFEARGLHGSQPRSQTFADPFDCFLSSPVVAEGRVIFGSGDGQVRALDAASGRLQWAFQAADVVHASPAVADGLVVVGDWASRLYALDLQTGAERWRFQAGVDPLMANQQGFQSSPAIADGRVYVGCRDAHCYALDLATGREAWKVNTAGSWVIASPAVQGGKVVFATSDSALIHIVDAASGKPLAEHKAKAYMFGSPVIAGRTLLIGAVNGSLEGRDWPSGELLWTWRTEASQANPHWVLTAEGRMNNAMNFASTWRESMGVGFERMLRVGSIFSTPWVTEAGLVVFGSADGRVYALG